MVDTRNVGHARHDARRDDDAVVAARDELLRRRTRVELKVDARAVEPVVEIFDGFVELLFAWEWAATPK